MTQEYMIQAEVISQAEDLDLVEISIPGVDSVFLVVQPSTGIVLAGELHEEFAENAFMNLGGQG